MPKKLQNFVTLDFHVEVKRQHFWEFDCDTGDGYYYSDKQKRLLKGSWSLSVECSVINGIRSASNDRSCNYDTKI